MDITENAPLFALFPSPSLPSISRDFEDGVFILHLELVCNASSSIDEVLRLDGVECFSSNDNVNICCLYMTMV